MEGNKVERMEGMQEGTKYLGKEGMKKGWKEVPRRKEGRGEIRQEGWKEIR